MSSDSTVANSWKWLRTSALWLSVLLFLLPPSLSIADEPESSDRVLAIYPVTSGRTHGPDRPISRIAVLSSQTGPSVDEALAGAKEVFQRGGIVVIDSQPSSWPERHGPEPRTRSADPHFLALGAHVGADHVVLVEVLDTLVLEDHRAAGTAYLHDERVSVRGLSVASGTVVLEGTARWSHPIERAGDHIRELTAYAIGRAICEPEKWVEASAANQGRGRCRR